ncbi:hypothetical protein AJ78_04933 [Emergomyces pasteurianus Ep9510]|uniref:Carboxylesterase type B domain-containing protein n=1 Tax=Emergomyces pasteurianus Ep9510 TaxID=1447872 RepID=A0A1J9QF39_9EURO|nr:hypothetical protein AJ78_04933 [Emergomyces pasteurianus Ep9510]
MLIPFSTISVFFALSYLSVPAQGSPTYPDAFPEVNLGYAIHVPTSLNKTSSGLKYANYNNIRFAAPPVGRLRFRKPKLPLKQEGIQNGSVPRFSTDCVSAIPSFFPDLGLGTRSWGQEDCLFLNVRVPEGVKKGDNVPVLHFIHGSGYVYGSKDFEGVAPDGTGLYENIHPSSQKFIYVASNYRMGLFGWSSSPSEDMDANIGLHDTKAALDWTRKYISNFGGDPDRITAMGTSAGAAMINLLLVAKGGHEVLPFDQAFMSSPCIWPRRDPARQQAVFDEVLKAANCTSVACLRAASPEVLFKVNSFLITDVGDGSTGALGPLSGFTPIVDGEYIKDLPPALLARGSYNRNMKRVVVGNMANEGMGLSLDVGMPDSFPALVRKTMPYADNDTIKRIQSMYTYPAEQPEKLSWDWTTDMSFACNAYFTAKAYKNKAQRYIMTVPPATHGLDQSYFFFHDNVTTPVTDITLAREFQEYVRRFVTGERNQEKFPDLARWPKYGPGETSFNITLGGFEMQKDYWDINRRCQVLNDIFNDRNNGA